MNKKGFTLLEVLAAMAIFSMIIVMMGNIFHQASIAWDSGTRKAQGAIEARVILANIARELQHAVALQSDPLDLAVPHSVVDETSLRFISVADREDINVDGSSRDAVRITYQMQGKSVMRSEAKLSSGSDYSLANASFGPDTDYILATNVHRLTFSTAPASTAPALAQNPDEALPRWVTISLEMGRLDEVSGVAAVSFGKNGRPDAISDPDNDDIKTY